MCRIGSRPSVASPRPARVVDVPLGNKPGPKPKQEKQCKVCHVVKPRAEFPAYGGLTCRDCMREKERAARPERYQRDKQNPEYVRKNRERAREYKRRKREERNVTEPPEDSYEEYEQAWDNAGIDEVMDGLEDDALIDSIAKGVASDETPDGLARTRSTHRPPIRGRVLGTHGQRKRARFRTNFRLARLVSLDADGCHCRKPKPGMITYLLDKFGLIASESLIVGDSGKDIMAGKAAGIKTVLLTTAYNRELQVQPDYQVSSLQELFTCGLIAK